MDEGKVSCSFQCGARGHGEHLSVGPTREPHGTTCRFEVGLTDLGTKLQRVMLKIIAAEEAQ